MITNFWLDNWVKDCGSLVNYAIAPLREDTKKDCVVDFVTNGEWNRIKLENVLCIEIVNKIFSMLVLNSRLADHQVCWKGAVDGKFSIKLAYRS